MTQTPDFRRWFTLAAPALGDRWQLRAACADDPDDPAWFVHPTSLSTSTQRRLALTCWVCPVRRQCFQSAVAEQSFGTTRAGHWFGRRRPSGDDDAEGSMTAWNWALPFWAREGLLSRDEIIRYRNLGEPV